MPDNPPHFQQLSLSPPTLLQSHLAQELVEVISSSVEPDLTLLFACDQQDLHLVGHGSTGTAPLQACSGTTATCLCHRVARDAKAVYCEETCISLKPGCRIDGARAFAALPLMAAGEVIGVLALASAAPRDFSAHSLEPTMPTLSLGFKNALLLAQREKQLQELSRSTGQRALGETGENALIFLESLLAQSPMGIRVFDGETGQCVQANQAAVDIAGGTLETLLSQGFRELPSWHKAGLTTVAEAVLEDGVARPVASDMVTSFGKPVAARYFLSRFIAHDRKYLLVVGRDATDEKRLEEENRRIEAQMLHVQKLESLGVLAGGIAHDFNNILMAVLGNADLAMLQLPSASPVRDNIVKIEQAARRAADLAGQMLAYSGKGHFVVETFNINNVIQEMTHMLDVSVTKKAAMQYQLAPDVPPIEADMTQVRQIIMNLVINASEAIGDNSGLITISTGKAVCDRAYLSEMWLDENLPEGLYAFLEVSDTGCGMDKETVEKIFEPFFTTKFTGRGLGMAAVLGIVRGHKGAIKVYSEKGKGSNFKILLPASSTAMTADLHLPHSRSLWQQHVTILLVDDEPTIRTLGEDMLMMFGFKVLTAGDGREALEVFRRHQHEIACVILDLTMPYMDGEETFRELCRISKDVQVIISSGYMEQEVTRRFVGKGLAGYIQKPYHLADLEKVLQQVIGPPEDKVPL